MGNIETVETGIFGNLLLLALPAAGKSEIKKYLRSLDPQVLHRDFHIGEMIQLDDFPYVHFMRRVDEELLKIGSPTMFFQHPNLSFIDPDLSWRTLIELVNHDYFAISRPAPYEITDNECANTLFDRINQCWKILKYDFTVSDRCDSESLKRIIPNLEQDARKILEDINSKIPSSMKGRTLIIEFARGGPVGSLEMKKTIECGYKHSLEALHPGIMQNACILYVKVDPIQSLQKNFARAVFGKEGSDLNHYVPHYVMAMDYGCDDLQILLNKDLNAGETIEITQPWGKYTLFFKLPTVIFDNVKDLTTFVRKSRWSKENKQNLHQALQTAFEKLWQIDRHTMRANWQQQIEDEPSESYRTQAGEEFTRRILR